MVSSSTLMQIAGLGGFICGTTGYYLFSRMADQIRSAPFYQKALDVLRDHEGANFILGSPIKDFRFSLSDDENNFCNGTEAHFEIPVSGPKTSGMYYFWAHMKNNEWIINKAELQERGVEDKRLVIVKGDTEEN